MWPNRNRKSTLLNTIVATLLGLAVILAIVGGLRALGLAQTGYLGTPLPQDRPPAANPNVLTQPELAPDQVLTYECSDGAGGKIYTSVPCEGADGVRGAERPVEVTTIELAPPKS
jgi:hypothetical protein